MLCHVFFTILAAAGADDKVGLTAEALQAAPPAKVEKLGVIQRLGRLATRRLVPATKRSPAREVIAFWSMADRQWFATFVVNLADGTVRKVEAPGFDRDAPRWPSVVGLDGKVYFSCMRGSLAVYDPEKDAFTMLRPIEKAGWLRGLAVGADGAVYCTDYPTGSAARYDPVTGQVERYGRQGGPFRITRIYGYSIGAEGDWVYTAVGKIPWYVVAYNRKTKQQKTLFTFKQADFPYVITRWPDVYLRATVVDPKTHAAHNENYRLVGGRAQPVKAVPDARPLPGPPRAAEQPEVKIPGRGLPMEEGGAVFWYRRPEDRAAAKAARKGATLEAQGWRKVLLPIPGEPYRVRRIAPMGDGRLIVATGIYGDVFLYDPKTGATERVGNPANRNVYCLLAVDGTLYFGGYSNAFLGRFEDGNGRLLYDWNRMLGSKRSRHMVLGADGRIYLGCHAEREFVGGSLAWWDPKAPKGKEPGGIRFPNDECQCLTTALDGHLIVYASRAVADPAHPEVKATDGRLIVYDTRERKIVQNFAPLPGEAGNGSAGNGSAGMIIEIAPGVVLGLSIHQGKPTLYTADVRAGKVLQQRALPAAAKGDLQRGPDGMLYTFLGGTLVRIEPRSLRIQPLGKAAPGRMAFLGNDLYLAGDFELRRIRNVTEL